MILPPLRYLRPASLAEAVHLLDDLDGAAVLAGGQTLLTVQHIYTKLGVSNRRDLAILAPAPEHGRQRAAPNGGPPPAGPPPNPSRPGSTS
ncbi:MAG TPA: hypothetical protein VHJ17_25055 [Thermomonospora sp.]|nr:hypothetical protein [Thermomonospora sp.]